MTRGQLPKAYLRLDPNIDQVHPDWPGMVLLILLGNRQPRRGRFRELDVPEAAIGKDRVAKLVARGDLSQEADGSWLVQGWDLWQEGDLDVGERMRRVRARRNGAVTRPSQVTDELRESDAENVTEPVTNPSPPSEASRRLDVLPNRSIKTRAEEPAEPAPRCPVPEGPEGADPVNRAIAELIRWVHDQTGLDPTEICKRVTMWNGRWLVNPFEGSQKRRQHTLDDLREWRTRLLADGRAAAERAARAGERVRTPAQLEEFRRGLADFKAALNGGGDAAPGGPEGEAEGDQGGATVGSGDPAPDPLPVAAVAGSGRPP